MSTIEDPRKVRLKDYGKSNRDRSSKRSAEASIELCEIGDIPPCYNHIRRKSCEDDLLLFLETYFPHSTGLSPFGEPQIRAIKRIEQAVIDSGWVCNVLPRGFVKSTISENSLLWAVLYGYRKFALFFAGTSSLSLSGIRSILQELLTNELLMEDFPEACFPLVSLEGRSVRARTQTYKGVLTNASVNKDMLRLAMIPGYPCSGSIVQGFGLLSPPRGIRFKDEKGRNVRPDISIIDDPSTDVSAKSDVQNGARMSFIKNSISMMGGHGKPMSLVVNATVIQEGDLASQLCDPEVSQEWDSMRVPMVIKMPIHLDSMWFGEYARIRKDFDRHDPAARGRARQASTKYLADNYALMHEGAEVSWEYVGLDRFEISALQHAINIWIDKGAASFFAECQNAPLKPTTAAAFELTAEIAHRKTGYARRVVPGMTSFITFGIDVHDSILYYTVLATQSDFTGSIIDYGTWPEQDAQQFTMRSAKRTLEGMYGNGSESAIEQGVEELIYRILNERWGTQNGDLLAVSQGLVDRGYKPVEVRNAIRKNMPQSAIVFSSRGIGIGPTKRPMAEYDLSPKRVIRFGPDARNPRWIFPVNERDGQLFGVNFDTNFWKDVVAARFLQNSRKGRFDFYGGRNDDHALYVSHMLAESPKLVSADGRSVHVWTEKGNLDNHFWDSLVLSTVAANLAGAQLPNSQVVEEIPAPLPTKKPKSYDDDEDNFGDFFACARDQK